MVPTVETLKIESTLWLTLPQTKVVSVFGSVTCYDREIKVQEGKGWKVGSYRGS